MRRAVGRALLAGALLAAGCGGRVRDTTGGARAAPAAWRIETGDGVPWIVTPSGARFFSIGVNAVNGGGARGYDWAAHYPDLRAWAGAARGRLLAWNFDTIGAWSVEPRDTGLPTMPILPLGVEARFHWGDPFDPAMPERLRDEARRLAAPYRGDSRRIGYFTDNEMGWWGGALFAWFVARPASNHTKQRLVALLREHYGDDWRRFTRDFVPPPDVTSFTALLARSGAPTRLRAGGDGIRLVGRFTGLVAAHYYRLVQAAVRDADPGALVLGDRLPIYYDPAAVRAMAPWVDVVSTNYNVDSPDGWIARYYFDGLSALTGGTPVLVSEWFFAAHENRTGNRNDGHLMTVATQAERARGAAAAARRLAAAPGVVGLHWFQYYDHPRGGRGDGEDYNFGLVDVADCPYETLAAALAEANARLAAIHASPPAPPAGARAAIPAAAVDATDRSLAEWPKEAALVPDLVAPPPDVPFGDLYLAWSARGLHLALIGMDYWAPGLLAYTGEFPREEAFRVDLGLDAGAGPRRFALHVVPPHTVEARSPPRMRAELCRQTNGGCAPVAGATVTYFGSDQPRITLEMTLPWETLGRPAAPRELRVALAATAFHRARWMSSSGIPPADTMRDPSGWRTLALDK